MAMTFQVTFDCADVDAQAAFWAAALGYIVQPPPPGYSDWPAFLAARGVKVRPGAMSAIVDREGVGPRLFFQRVPEPKTAKNRMHLDLNVLDPRQLGPDAGRARLAAEVARLTELGAAKVRDYEEPDQLWTVMLDPEGNEFCLH